MIKTLNTLPKPPTIMFSAHKNGVSQSMPTSDTKITFPYTNINMGGCYDTATSKFTPTIAGVYLFVVSCYFAASATGKSFWCCLWKNNTTVHNIGQIHSSFAGDLVLNGSCLIYMNGTTDYVETYFTHSDTTRTLNGTINSTYFQGSLL